MHDISRDPTNCVYVDMDRTKDGKHYRIKVEIRVADMAEYMAARAMCNRTKQSRMAFAKATARLIKD